MRPTKRQSFFLIGLLPLMVGPLGPALGQSHDHPPLVVQAVAPVFPPLAVAAAQDGTVLVDLHIDAKGAVETLQIVEGPKLLHRVVEIAARRWMFSTAETKMATRLVRISFIFKLVPQKTSSEEILPIFRPPYQVEVRTRFPTITKYTNQESKHKRRVRRRQNDPH